MEQNWKLHREAYCKDGFAIVKGLISKDIIQTILKDFNQVLGLKLDDLDKDSEEFDGKSSVFNNMKKLHSIDTNAYLGVVKRVPKVVSLQGMFLSDRIVKGAKEVVKIGFPSISTEPIFHIMSDELKIEGGYFGLKPHQDWTSVQGSLDMVVIWVPLVEVTSKNFPLLVIPGSHKKGLLS